MQLLIVHHDAEVGEALRGMVQEFAGHPADYVASDAAAQAWAGEHADCDVLVTQLEATGVDGLTLSNSLGKVFPRLRTLFLPAYTVAAQPLEIARSKVFPEPISGERLLASIAPATEGDGAGNLFHLMDLLQMCCLSGKTGALQMTTGLDKGVIFLCYGEIRHAVTAQSQGIDALYEILCWGPAEFSYDANANPAEKSIELGWDAALIEVLTRKREAQAQQPEKEEVEPEVATAPLAPEPDLTGQNFGTYKVGRKLAESFWDKIYEAEQTSVGRRVVLHILRGSLRGNPERAQEFIDTASVNANIRHPAILPVYEAGEIDGTHFYAREYVVGRTLYEMKAGGLTISALLALRVIRAVAEAFAHLDAHQIFHAPLRLSRIFVTPNEEARLAEIAVANPALAQAEPAQNEIQMLGRTLIPMTKATAMPGSGRVLKLIHQMTTTGDNALTEWTALAEETKTLEALVAPIPLVSPKKSGLLGKVKFWGKISAPRPAQLSSPGSCVKLTRR